MSVSSSSPSIFTWTSRSPLDIWRVALESRPILTSRRSPKNFHATYAIPMVRKVITSSDQNPSCTRALDRSAALSAERSAEPTNVSTRFTSSSATCRLCPTRESALAISSSSPVRVAKTPSGAPCSSLSS